MKWFSSLTSKLPPVVDEPAEQYTGVHLSPGLRALFEHSRVDRKYHILDLGPALKENVDFYSRFRCKVYIEDLYQSLLSFDLLDPEDGLSYAAVFEYLLPYRKGTRFDFILAWDLFNYLEREEFRYLSHHLRRYCHPGTQLFAIFSLLRHIPEQPLQYRILDEDHVLYQGKSTVLRPSPQYQQTDFNHLMPNFRVATSFLLRNGVREHIFAPA